MSDEARRLAGAVVICGSRDGVDRKDIDDAMDSAPWIPMRVLSGRARGADIAGEEWAWEHEIPIDYYPADWRRLGKRAGPMRNREMATECTAVVAVWDGKSRGTAHMIASATRLGKPVFIWPVGAGDE